MRMSAGIDACDAFQMLVTDTTPGQLSPASEAGIMEMQLTQGAYSLGSVVMDNFGPVTIFAIIGLIVSVVYVVFPAQMSKINRGINRSMGPKWMSDSFITGHIFIRLLGVVAIIVCVFIFCVSLTSKPIQSPSSQSSSPIPTK